MFDFIEANDLFENEFIVLVETSFKTENGIKTVLEVAVKNGKDDISTFIPVIVF